MSFNLRKIAAETQEKMLHKQHSGTPNKEGTGAINRLLQENRKDKDKDKDKDLIEGELNKDRRSPVIRTTENHIENHTPMDGVSKRTGNDKHDQLPINLLEELRHREYAKAFQKAQKTEDTEFWDEGITQEIGDAPSQLHNDKNRFNKLKEDNILNNEGVKNMVMASLKDADAMIYYIYRSAAECGRKLTDNENKLIKQISQEKQDTLEKIAVRSYGVKEVEFEMEIWREDGDRIVQIRAVGEIQPPDRSVGFMEPYINDWDIEASDENGEVELTLSEEQRAVQGANERTEFL